MNGAVHTSPSRSVAQVKPPAPAVKSAPTSEKISRSSSLPVGPPAIRLGKKNSLSETGYTPGLSAGSEPLTPGIRTPLEQSLQVDLQSVRLHTDTRAQNTVKSLSARAFTYGNHIFLGPGERETDLGLMAHETAHVVQQQSAPTLQRWTLGQHDIYEHEAQQASNAVLRNESFTVKERTNGPQLQRLSISDALDYFADKANLIPGYRMFTIILGVNPINMSRVERSAANILRALIEFIPGGGLITKALDSYGILEKVGNWVDQQIRSLGVTVGIIKKALSQFLDSLSWRDVFHLGDVWNRAKRIFTEPIDRIINFAKGLISGIIKFIKDAILMPLAKLAEKTRGWSLLIALLGKNPITGEAVPRTAETLIGGFMKLIGQEEVWENIKKGKAIERAWAWFQRALKGLMAFVRTIPHKIIDAITSLTIKDIVTVVGAFGKIVGVFVNIATDFISWGFKQVLSLLEIIFSVVAPKVMPYIAKAKAAFHTILKNPVAFVGNLVRAGRLGFNMFAKNILGHLKTALIKWITGPLGAAGVYIPQSFSLLEIIKLVLSVLGLTWQNIRTKLVKIIPEPVLVGLEKTAGILVTLVKDGPAAAWEQIKTELTELKDQMIAQITEMITTEVVKAAVVKLVSMLNPAGAVIQAIIAIYKTITFFIQKINQIAAVVASFIDSISAIASGQVENAAKKVEQTMANTLTVVIAFLAKFVGLGNVPEKLVGVIKKIRQPIDKGLDKIVAWLGNMLKKLVGMVKTGVKKLLAWWKADEPIPSPDGQQHHIYLDGNENSSKLMVASSPMDAGEAIKLMKQAKADPGQINQAMAYKKTIDDAVVLLVAKNKAMGVKATPGNRAAQDAVISTQNKIMRTAMRGLAKLLGKNVFGQVKFENLQDTVITPASGGGKATTIEAAPLSAKRKMGTPPSAYPVGWDAIVDEGLTSKEPNYVRLHLINENFGGSGGSTLNLVPGSKQNNSDHLYTVENQLKDLIGKSPGQSDKLAQVWYKAVVNYRSNNETTWKNAKYKTIKTSDFAKSIRFTWGFYKHVKGNEWKKDTTKVIGNFTLGPIPLPKL